MLDNLLCNIATNKINSTYSHENEIKVIDGKTCINCDCSGFLYFYLQKQKKLRALQEIKDFVLKHKEITEEHIKKIYAHEYAMFFKKLESETSCYWQVLKNPHELKSGDIIIFANAQPQIENNDHCMIVRKVNEIQKGFLRLEVMDSTKFPHLKDSRKAQQTGIGCGEICLRINEKGQWTQFKRRSGWVEKELFFAKVR